MSKYFGHSPQDWERSMMRGPQAEVMKDAMNNPQNYTKSQPNAASKAAFVVGSNVGAGRDGMKKGPDTAYYKIERAPAPAAAPASAPAPAPPPPPKEQSLAIEPVKHSLEIEQAKERVNAYENKSKSSSAWEQAQANVQSSFIKPTSSNLNQEVDFSSNTFEANQSSKPNEQAQSAQNQMQNYISKYSQYKSSN